MGRDVGHVAMDNNTRMHVQAKPETPAPKSTSVSNVISVLSQNSRSATGAISRKDGTENFALDNTSQVLAPFDVDILLTKVPTYRCCGWTIRFLPPP